MHAPVIRPTDEPDTQGGRKAFEGCAVSRTDAPGATQYQGDGWVGFKHRLQNRNPFEQGVSCSLIRAHVDTLAWVPEHFFVVNNTVKVQVQNDVRTARSGCGEIGGILTRGHCCKDPAGCYLACGDDDMAERIQFRTHAKGLTTARAATL